MSTPRKPFNMSAEDSEKFDKLQTSRLLAVRAVGKISQFVDEFENQVQTVQELVVREVHLLRYQQQFEEAQEALLNLIKDDQIMDDSLQFGDNFLSQVMRTQSSIKLLTLQHGSSANSTFHGDSAPRQPPFKMPEVKLPLFSGGYSSWQSFKRLFLVLVDHLEPVVKLQILLGQVKDQPYRMIEQVNLSNAGYVHAWEILDKKYGNKRLQFNAHFKAIYDLPAMTKESAVELRTLVDNMTIQLRALEALNQPVQHWSSWLVFHMSTRLDAETYKQWESLLQVDEIPSWQKMIEFLEQRACTLLNGLEDARKVFTPAQNNPSPSNTQSTRPVNNPFSKNHQRSHTFVTHINSADNNNNPSEHQPLARDKQFRQMLPPDKLQLIQQLNACTNCLSPTHQLVACPSFNSCLACNSRHHTQLHDCFAFSRGFSPGSIASNLFLPEIASTSQTSNATFQPHALGTAVHEDGPELKTFASVTEAEKSYFPPKFRKLW